jgi:regulator of cell morphogenesis and NO signaling
MITGRLKKIKHSSGKQFTSIVPDEISPDKNIVYNDRDNESVGQMVVADYRVAMVFNKYGLDYCFRGRDTLRIACEEKNISLAQVEREIRAVKQQPGIYNLNFNDWPLDYLVDFILTNHHRHVRKYLLLINEQFQHLSQWVKDEFPISLISETFQRVATEMSAYLVEEEQVIFPYIRFLAQVIKGNIPAGCMPEGCMEHRMMMMELEKSIIGENMEFIRKLSKNYSMSVHKNSCTRLFESLREFDSDLQQHFHLENNILIPKTIQLEKECLGNANFINAPTRHPGSREAVENLL